MQMSKTFDLRAGNSEFYVDPTYYDYEFKNRTEDVEWYVHQYQSATSTVLELAIGSGRIALKAVALGVDVVGIDLAPAMLTQAKAHYEKLKKSKRGQLNMFRADMRSFQLDRKFDLITCPFNAFQHLYTRQDVEACLERVRAHLAPGGRFILDVLTPDLEYLIRSPYKTVPGVRFRHPTYRAYYTYSERSAYDPVTQLNQMWFHYEKCNAAGDGPPEVTIQLSHRYFYPEELGALLHYNGFEVLNRYGDFENEPLDADSDSMVLVCRSSQSADGHEDESKSH
jgi:SAM-dependent methyltransferase